MMNRKSSTRKWLFSPSPAILKEERPALCLRRKDSHFAVTLLRLRRLRCKCELGYNDDIIDVSGVGGTSGLVMMLIIEQFSNDCPK